MTPHITLSSNTSWYLYNFRGNLIRNLIDRGYKITLLAPTDDFTVRLKELGCDVIDLPMDNKGTNPWRDYRTMKNFKRHYQQICPDVVLHFTIKPVVYGTLAACSLKIPVINTITGLGTAFLREGPLMKVAECLYRISQSWPDKVFFQNCDDYDLFLNRRLVAKEKAECLPGSGVDLEHFTVTAYPNHSSIIFLFFARMLWDKGVGEFVDAARQLKVRHPEACFQLLGPLDVANPTAISNEEVTKWEKEGLIEYLGETDDVRPYITAANCVVLPSYREGMPRTILEASAMGRPVIATDVPGCRDAIEDGVTGLLCRQKDADNLSEKMNRFIQMTPEIQGRMGLAGRKKMELEFDEKIVIARYADAIEKLL